MGAASWKSVYTPHTIKTVLVVSPEYSYEVKGINNWYSDVEKISLDNMVAISNLFFQEEEKIFLEWSGIKRITRISWESFTYYLRSIYRISWVFSSRVWDAKFSWQIAGEKFYICNCNLKYPHGLCPRCAHIYQTHQRHCCLANIYFITQTFYEWLNVLRCHYVHRHASKILKTYSESSFPGSFNDTSFSSLEIVT